MASPSSLSHTHGSDCEKVVVWVGEGDSQNFLGESLEAEKRKKS